jgi:hypothetical protein
MENSRSFARPRTGVRGTAFSSRWNFFRRDMSCRARRTGRLQPDRRQGAGAGLTPEGREVGTADQAPRGTVMKQVGYLCMDKGPARDVWEFPFFLVVVRAKLRGLGSVVERYLIFFPAAKLWGSLLLLLLLLLRLLVLRPLRRHSPSSLSSSMPSFRSRRMCWRARRCSRC